MSFDDDDQQYLDNSDNNTDEDQESLEGEGHEESDDDSDKVESKGNLGKALQEERQKRRELEQRLKDNEQRAIRAEALLERVGSPQQSKPDNANQRIQLQEWMLEKPDEYAGWIQQQTKQEMLKQFAPVLATQASRIISRNPDHKAVYDIPEVQSVIDQYIVDQIENGNVTQLKDLEESLPNLMESVIRLRGGIGGTSSVQQDPAKKKLTSTVGKGSSTSTASKRSVDEIWADKEKLRNQDRKAWAKWADTPEGKKVRQVMFERAFKGG